MSGASQPASDEAQGARHADNEAYAGGRAHGPVDRHAEQREQRHAQRTASDAHEGRNKADAAGKPRACQALGRLGSEAPAFTAEGEVAGNEKRHDGKDEREPAPAHPACEEATGDDAGDEIRRPAAQERAVHGVPRSMGKGGAERGRNDRRKRGADRKVHPNALVNAERREDMKQHRHDYDAAANAEEPGDETSHKSRESKCEREEPERIERGMERHAPPSRPRRPLAARTRPPQEPLRRDQDPRRADGYPPKADAGRCARPVHSDRGQAAAG